ncbi:fungal-specific transcription factor domain-containing protein [Paraphoma chrysanthemicola]|nr:fungal-specific transcription factor domain-containing protein [Paraphoma chrysanthemicola]
MSTRSAEAESREGSPDRDGSPGAKRTSKKRKVLSCYACRNRKMKCDRVYPICSRCQKTGRADQCTYDPRLLDDLTNSNGLHADGHNADFAGAENGTQEHADVPTSLEALQWKSRAQERRIEELERKLASKEKNSDPSRYVGYHPAEPDQKEEMMFRGKGFKTQFHGSTSVMSTIAQYRELQAFTREALTVDHSIMRVRIDFKTFRDRRKAALKEIGARTHGTNEEVFAALPERNVVDSQAALYFRTCETTYRILHEPSFWKEYNTFWDGRPSGAVQPGFAVILILLVACTQCLSPKDDVFLGDTTADRQTASDLIDVCDAWIMRQSRKRLTLQFFQLHCLSLLARRVNCVKLKQDWITSGDLVRLALAAGMHRDPSLLSTGKISAFEMEMKKRLWVTIMEFEMQSSIETGLQSSLTALHWDTPDPANLPDEAFSTESQEVPASRPADHFTSASYLRFSRSSVPFRLHLMQLLNDPSEKLTYSEVLHYDAQIHEMVAALPKWDDPRALIPSALLELQLRQFLLLMHKSYAKLASHNDRYLTSFSTCINAAGSIMAIQEELLSKGILFLNHSRNDAIRVGLIMSEIAYHNCARSGPIQAMAPPPPPKGSQFADPQTHFADLPSVKTWAPGVEVSLAIMPQRPFLTRTLCASAIELLELAGQIYESKVMRVGTGYMEFWLLCAAMGMLPPPSSSKPPATSIAHITTASDDIQVRCRKTLDRFQSLSFRVLALQKDQDNSFATSLRTTMASASPSEVRTPLSTGAGAAALIVGHGSNPLVNNPSQPALSGMATAHGLEPDLKDMNGTFDNLQDMQVDMGGWNFPDFWAFDLAGEF